MSYTGPYTNFHEINLNLFIRALKKLKGGNGGESLVKKSNVEFDYEWKALTAQDVGALPDSYTAPVDSVNGKTGVVVLDAQDVGALPDSYIPPVTSVNGKTGTVILDSADIGFDESSVYNALINALPTDTAIGNPANFPDGADGIPIKGMTVAVEPVQSGSGNPSPDNIRPISGWTGTRVTRCGKNIFDESAANWKTGAYIIADGSELANIGYKYSQTFFKVRPNTTYTVQINKAVTANAATTVPCYDSNKNFLSRESAIALTTNTGVLSGTFTTPADCEYIRLNVPANRTTDIQVEVGAVATAYEAYQSENYPVDWTEEAGTVYGGTATYNGDGTWTLKSRPYYSSYAGETLVGPWVSDRDVYSAGTTPTTGAQVVDMGGAETICTITTGELISTPLGQNNIWADTGDVTVEYFANTKLYIDKQMGGA